MQVTQTLSEGLRREFKVVVAAGDIAKRLDEKLSALRNRVRVPGFRPGKAPIALLKRQYGKAALGEVLEETVSSVTQEAMRQHELRPAVQPKIEVTGFGEGTDLVYTMAVEVMPEIEPGDLRKIKLEKLVARVAETDVDAMIAAIAAEQKNFVPVAEARPAAKGDSLVIDFTGTHGKGGKPFEGGSATDFVVEVGAGTLIPDFDNQLIGATAGADLAFDATFPADYGNKALAGKAVHFTVKVKALRERKPVAVDDELAKRLGVENLGQLRENVRRHLEQDLTRMSRVHLKRRLLDALAATHDFMVPSAMVEQEFEQIWQQLKSDPAGAAELAAGKNEDAVKAEYRTIAERRVRLGLLLAEVGRRNNIQVRPEEASKAMLEQARRFPGQERQVMEFLRENPEAMARLRAPILEDKTVDFILEMATVSEREASREELLREPELPAPG
jgi:trigger factor